MNAISFHDGDPPVVFYSYILATEPSIPFLLHPLEASECLSGEASVSFGSCELARSI